MENYPVLRAMIRYGQALSILSGAVAFACAASLLYPLWSYVALLPALVVGGVLYAVVKSYVELIRLVSETLAPE